FAWFPTTPSPARASGRTTRTSGTTARACRERSRWIRVGRESSALEQPLAYVHRRRGGTVAFVFLQAGDSCSVRLASENVAIWARSFSVPSRLRFLVGRH